MKKSTFVLFAICVAALLLPSTARLNAADVGSQGPLSADTKRLDPTLPDAVSNTAKLKNTVVNFGSGAASTAGFVALDAPTEVDCTVSKCVYEAVQNVQVLSGTAGNRVAFCTAIDGTYMGAPNCAYVEALPNDGWYHARTFVALQGDIPYGTHSVQTYLYTDNGSTVANWGLTYHVYKQKK